MRAGFSPYEADHPEPPGPHEWEPTAPATSGDPDWWACLVCGGDHADEVAVDTFARVIRNRRIY